MALDNLLTGRIENIEDLFGRDGFSFIKHDVTNFIHVAGPLDAVLHFASPASGTPGAVAALEAHVTTVMRPFRKPAPPRSTATRTPQ